MDFENRVVMVTGAAGNLGRAVSQAFAARGARLALVARKAEDLAAVFGAEDERRVFAPADLTDQRQVDAAAALVAQRFGRIDVLCNLAGGFAMGSPVHETPDALWHSMMDLNALTVVRTARAVVPRMIAAGSGRIVNVAAAAALGGKAGMGAYCASKSAVIRLTETMSAELREQGVNVNCVLPSIIDTPQNRAAMPAADARRWVSPEALAEVVVFLGSDAARDVHGAAVPVVGSS